MLPQTQAVDLTGTVALVTGASGGLGRRFAQTLAAAGAAVAVAARRMDRLTTLVEEIRAQGQTAFAVEMDVRDPASITRAVETVERELGLVQILVNNAGIPDAQWATKMSLELIDNVIDTNFRAPFLIACEVARRLIAADKKGRIVNLSSAGAYYYPAGAASTLYCATKAGVSRLTDTLALEWARYGINVNAIAPGLFRSEMSEGLFKRVGERAALGSAPRGRVGEPHHLDSTLLYLVSPASEFVTGTCIRVDDAQVPR